MKKAFLTAFLLTIFSFASFSLNIPKKLMGQYETDVPDFDFEDNGRTVHAAGYHLSLILKEAHMIYRAGKIELKGEYTAVADNGGLLDVEVEITNNISVDFDLELTIDKKTGSIAVRGLKGIPEITLQKREIQVTKKNTRFRRL